MSENGKSLYNGDIVKEFIKESMKEFYHVKEDLKRLNNEHKGILDKYDKLNITITEKYEKLYEKLLTKIEVVVKELDEKIDRTDRKVTNLQLKLGSISAAVAIITTIIFKFVLKL